MPEAAQQLRFEGVSYRPIKAEARDCAELIAVWRADDENPAAARAREVIFDASQE